LTLADRLMARGRMVLAFAATLVLLGCATPPRPADVQTASWQGRLSIVVDSVPRESHRANFDLMGTAKVGELLLLSPLGTTVAQARWTQDAVLLTQGSRSVRYDNLDDLSAELLGAALPIDALFDWLQGRGTRAAGWRADLCRLAEGRLVAERQNPQPRARLTLLFEPSPLGVVPPCEPLS
jgi:outer membrane lipoprotein LolB